MNDFLNQPIHSKTLSSKNAHLNAPKNKSISNDDLANRLISLVQRLLLIKKMSTFLVMLIYEFFCGYNNGIV